ncbi:MAG: 4-oxalocrotonate tautomerase family protein [Campylobacter ureolyticus]|uniref:4-oxalocrotonate tautomerase family protein n=1 Tax=Campylobacter ureolyticus TaxID=827 RepID=UPI0022B4EBFA|nr:4-oxalocrotonate tautomerase family protein [Campylobacter ureolyticus]MCZ6103304.1 4-oxalocrotonate tautomerase family protein [Campylobacter ureolyticus]MDU4981156.1 4-oxalocrotonate tautomerase family protein [Campylobacter ureolyticus]
MPFVKICVTKENDEPTKEQKELLINGVTNLINEVLGKNKSSTVVIIEEINIDNYGLGGKSITNLRKK